MASRRYAAFCLSGFMMLAVPTAAQADSLCQVQNGGAGIGFPSDGGNVTFVVPVVVVFGTSECLNQAPVVVLYGADSLQSSAWASTVSLTPDLAHSGSGFLNWLWVIHAEENNTGARRIGFADAGANGGSSLYFLNQNPSLHPHPNLTVTSVGFTPVSASPGGSITISDTVTNSSVAPAAASTNQYYLDATPTRTALSILMVGGRAVSSLVGNGTNSGSASAAIPDTTPGGDYSVIACADGGLAIAESNENDNCRSTGTTVSVSSVRLTSISDPPSYVHIGPPPFKIGPSAAFPDEVTNTFEVTATLSNSGLIQSSPDVLNYYLSTGSTKDTLIGDVLVPAIAPNATQTIKVSLVVPAGTLAGPYYILGCLSHECRASNSRALVIDFKSAIDDGVTGIDLTGGAMNFDFVSRFFVHTFNSHGITAKQAAELGGFDHLNWHQMLVEDVVPKLPTGGGPVFFPTGLDPALGGNFLQRLDCTASATGQFTATVLVQYLAGLLALKPGADQFPWYLNEVLLGCKTADDLYVVGRPSVHFTDTPDVGLPGRTLTFETYLAGVYANGDGRILKDARNVHVRWIFTQIVPTKGVVPYWTVEQGTAGPAVGMTQFLGFVEPEDFTPERIGSLKAAGGIPADAFVTVQPDAGVQSHTFDVQLTGTGTHFLAGSSVVSFSGGGIRINRLLVTSPTSASVSISVAADATPSVRNVVVTTADEVAVAPYAFAISPAPILRCDANGDGAIDMADLLIIRNANGQTASSANDPRDGNGDGAINVADVRFCQLRLTPKGQ